MTDPGSVTRSGTAAGERPGVDDAAQARDPLRQATQPEPATGFIGGFDAVAPARRPASRVGR